MSKPLTHYIDTPAIRSICNDYESDLEGITFTEHLVLMSIISQFLAAIADDPDEYDLLAAADDNPLEQTDEVHDILRRLQAEISESTLKAFLLALSNYLYEEPSIANANHAAWQTLTATP